MADKTKRPTDQELADLACDLLTDLKPYGLMICELRRIVEHMEKAIDLITFGP